MKARYTVSTTPVLVRLGWNPAAFTVLNATGADVYVREGSADGFLGVSNFDYVVPAGGFLTIPTNAQNFSLVQAAGASRPAQVVFWSRDEIALSFGGGGADSILKVQVTGGNAVAITDHSGTCDGSDHVVLAAGTYSYILIQNPSSNVVSFWVDFGQAAVLASPAVEVAPGVTLTLEDIGMPSNDIHLIGPAGLAYTVKAG